jgi:hypothetical protein
VKNPLVLLSWALVIATAGIAAGSAPQAAGQQQTAPADDADDAQARNEGRSRPQRAAADTDDDDNKKAADAKQSPTHADEHEAAGKDHDDDDDTPSGRLSLSASQEEAVGLRIDSPQLLTSPAEVAAYATVLDPLALITESGRIESTRAAADAASADAQRQEQLYRDGAQASLKAVQAARAQSVEASTQARVAELSFREEWGPLAGLGGAQRKALLEALASGQRLLLRAEIPGRHLSGALGRDALIEVDGAHIAARVLGPLPRTEPQSQSSGWLLEVDRPPAGFGPGARTAARLQTKPEHGLVVPAGALFYAPAGTYVYRQISGPKPDTFAYESVPVKALTRIGQAWLVEGLARGDRIVVQGAGVLWSLQGLSSFSAAEEDHD